jgi:type IV pilus assembly protein PilV
MGVAKMNMIKNKKKNGYLMIEILITLIIFSLVTIGLFALQMKTTSVASSSSLRSSALSYANEMLDKMRANKTALMANSYLTYTGGAAIGSLADNSCKAVNYNITHTEAFCSSSQMAQDDLQEFQRQISLTLPQGAFVICNDSNAGLGTPTAPNCNDAGTDYVIKIFWKDSSSKSLNTNSGYSQVVLGAAI